LSEPMNRDLADALVETARLMELKGENPFKARAFRNAARTLEGLDRPASELLETGELAGIKGIGKGILGAIHEYLDRGGIVAADELRAAIPPVAFELLGLPELGPAKVRALLQHLELQSLDDLEAACIENRLLHIKGFGPRTQARIREGIRFVKRTAGQHRLGSLLGPALALESALAAIDVVERAALTGRIRRRRETTGEIALLVATGDRDRAARGVAEALAALEATLEPAPAASPGTRTGATRINARLARGGPIEVRFVTPEAFAPALALTTGSGEHVSGLRARAEERGLDLTFDCGLKKGARALPTPEEADVYAALDLAWIAPELREGRGEIEAAASGSLPALVEAADLRGCFHVHSTWSDGHNSLEAIARHGRAIGLAYIGIADHSRSAAYAGGLSIERLQAQGAEIDAVNAKGEGARLLKGVESDILPDGRLDYPDDVLAALDFVIGSVHSGLKMDRETATARVVRALGHPSLTLLGHPTGRLLLSREGYELDWDAVFAAAAAGNKIIEINAHPARLDLDWRRVRPAIEAGVRLAISPDAHDLEGFADLDYGVSVARKGWATAEDVINSRDDPFESLGG